MARITATVGTIEEDHGNTVGTIEADHGNTVGTIEEDHGNTDSGEQRRRAFYFGVWVLCTHPVAMGSDHRQCPKKFRP
jgi:hypothetical protein